MLMLFMAGTISQDLDSGNKEHIVLCALLVRDHLKFFPKKDTFNNIRRIVQHKL